MSDPTLKRRWFRFSLRTMFVVMTLACAWAAYQVNWIRQRHAALDFQRRGARYESLAHIKAEGERPAPASLRLFGETGHTRLIAYIYTGSDSPDSQHDYQRLQILFPEAIVLAVATHRGSIVDRELSARAGQ